jgi:hypothetical protein
MKVLSLAKIKFRSLDPWSHKRTDIVFRVIGDLTSKIHPFKLKFAPGAAPLLRDLVVLFFICSLY